MSLKLDVYKMKHYIRNMENVWSMINTNATEPRRKENR